MANKAYMIVEIEVSTDKRTKRQVEDDFASYIMPLMKRNAPMAVTNMKWVGCAEIHDERGEIVFQTDAVIS